MQKEGVEVKTAKTSIIQSEKSIDSARITRFDPDAAASSLNRSVNPRTRGCCSISRENQTVLRYTTTPRSDEEERKKLKVNLTRLDRAEKS